MQFHKTIMLSLSLLSLVPTFSYGYTTSAEKIAEDIKKTAEEGAQAVKLGYSAYKGQQFIKNHRIALAVTALLGFAGYKYWTKSPAAHELKGKAEEKAHQLKDKVKGTAHEWEDKAKHKAEEIKDKAHDKAKEVSKK